MKTAQEIFQDMCRVFTEKTGYEINADCDMAVRMYAAAVQVESLYIYNDWVLKQCFPQTASGEYLDLHAELRGTERKAAEKAKGEISFSVKSPAAADVAVPAGTVCMTAAGVMFKTEEAGTIKAGSISCTVPAAALNGGADGNVMADTVVFMTNPPVGVYACKNEKPFSGGSDAEDDDSLRARVLELYKSLPNGANRGWYEKMVSGVPGVGKVRVSRGTGGPGNIDIIITGTDGMPSDELISQVKQRLEDVRELCVDIDVRRPDEVKSSIEVEIEVDTGFDGQAVKEEVAAGLKKAINRAALGSKVKLADIGECVYHVPGVINYKIVSPVADISLDYDEMLTEDSVTVVLLWEG